MLPRRSDPHSVGREGFVAPAFDITRVPFFPPLWLFPGQIANPPVPGRENFLPPAGGFTLYFGFSGVKSTIVTVFGSGLKAHSRLSHTLMHVPFYPAFLAFYRANLRLRCS